NISTEQPSPSTQAWFPAADANPGRAGHRLLAPPSGTPKALSLIALLPPQHRLRRSSDFRLTSRRGRRVGTRTVVVHARKRDGGQVAEGKTNEDQTLVGF